MISPAYRANNVFFSDFDYDNDHIFPDFTSGIPSLQRNGTVDEQIGKTIERLRYYIPVNSVKFAET